MTELARFLGGVGLFLLGMAILTKGLRALAGGVLRRTLARATRTPATAALAGAGTTALVQSSSATAVAAVGFVGAGLLAFPQALGIIFGAKVGTTLTGWVVLLLGFKLKLSTVTQPLVLVGVLLTMFGRRRWRDVGWAVAGFGLLFAGIDVLQDAMAGLEGSLTPGDFPADTLGGRLQLVGLGVLITLVTQSSSAGVAAALAALATGTISFPQAAALVIGMDAGTCSTAALATIGGSTAMRRTGFAHVIFSVVTGVMAFLLLAPYRAAMDGSLAGGTAAYPQISLVAFHTAFNVLAVLLVVPVTRSFARLMIRLMPGEDADLEIRLDEQLLGDSYAATAAARAAARRIAGALFAILRRVTGDPRVSDVLPLTAPVEHAADETRRFAERIPMELELGPARDRHVDLLDALDHLARLERRLHQTERIRTSHRDHDLKRRLDLLRAALTRPDRERLERVRSRLRRDRRRLRRRFLRTGAGRDVRRTLRRLDALRWQYRVASHVALILAHLEEGRSAASGAAGGSEGWPG